MSKRHLRRSVFMTGLLASAISISACQPKPEPMVEDNVTVDEPVPMSAEPADPNDLVIVANDAALNNNDLTESGMPIMGTHLIYSCSPELDIDATYQDNEGTVRLQTAKGLLTLVKNPAETGAEVFSVNSELDGSTGFTQWRSESEDRESALLRTGANANSLSTYDCDILD